MFYYYCRRAARSFGDSCQPEPKRLSNAIALVISRRAPTGREDGESERGDGWPVHQPSVRVLSSIFLRLAGDDPQRTGRCRSGRTPSLARYHPGFRKRVWPSVAPETREL